MELGELTKVVDEIVDEKPKRKKRPTVAQVRELERIVAEREAANIAVSDREGKLLDRIHDLESANQQMVDQMREAGEFVERLRQQNDELHRKDEHLTRAIGHIGSAMQGGFAAKGGK